MSYKVLNPKLWRYFGRWTSIVLHLGVGLKAKFSHCKFSHKRRPVCVCTCVAVGRMAGKLIPLSSLVCTCGAKASSGFWLDKPALRLAPCGERLARLSPPVPPDTLDWEGDQNRKSEPQTKEAQIQSWHPWEPCWGRNKASPSMSAAIYTFHCPILHYAAITHERNVHDQHQTFLPSLMHCPRLDSNDIELC